MKYKILLFLLLVGQSVLATRYHVKINGDDTNDGLTWETSFQSLQKALNVIQEGDEIWVAEGTYLPSQAIDGTIENQRQYTFYFNRNMKIYGGFPSTGNPTMDKRNWDNYTTILSGDLNNNDVGNLTGQALLTDASRLENAYSVIISNNLDNTFIIDGFQISGGNSNNLYATAGGWTNANRTIFAPIIYNCNFLNNSGKNGGAIYTNYYKDNSQATIISNCIFKNNVSMYNGGAITYKLENGIVVLNSNQSRNKVDDENLIVINCIFSNNLASHDGGAIFNSNSNLLALNCVYVNNSAEEGGVIYNSDGSTSKMINCSFNGNIAETGGVLCNGIIIENPSLGIFYNSIFWNNIASANYPLFATPNGEVEVDYCLLQENICDQNDIDCGTNNLINLNPLFTNVESGDLSLLKCSPVIDFGNNALIPKDALDFDKDGNIEEPFPFDFANNNRIFNNGNVDLGAFEYQGERNVNIDLSTLTTLYNATNGDNWTTKTNWDITGETSCDPCNDNWYGITCENGRVTEINLEDNKLIGTLPTSIGDLSELKILNLKKNQIGNSIPIAIGNLSNLQQLTLSGNQLTGTIPSEIGNLSNLLKLELSFNQLDGSIPTEIGSNLFNLQELYLNNNQLTGSIPASFEDLSDLQILYLSTNELTGNIPAGLGNMASLRILQLYFNQLSGTIPPQLGNLSNLEVMYLSENQLTGTIAPELGDLPKIKELYLSYNQLTGEIPAALGNLYTLEELGLYNNQLTSVAPEIGNLAQLKRLVISTNLFTSVPSELGNLSNLTYLKLHTCQLTSIPDELGNLSKLEELYVYKNQLTSLPTTLGNLSNMTLLEAHTNKLTCLPSSFQNLCGQTTIDLSNNPDLVATDFDGFCNNNMSVCPPSTPRYHVKTDGDNDNDGRTWATAFQTLQKAIDVTEIGDEIWVAAGVYYPEKDRDGNSNPATIATKTYYINKDIKLFGGFPKTGNPSLNDRNPEKYLTTLSGDINEDDINTDGNQIAETYQDVVGVNYNRIMYLQQVTNAFEVDGFVFTAGDGVSGAGLVVNGGGDADAFADPNIRNCQFWGNRTRDIGTGGSLIISGLVLY